MRPSHWWYTLPLKLKSLLQGRRADAELDEEMQFHLDHLIAEGVAEGLSPAAARNAALRRMGGLTQRKEEARDMRGFTWLTDFVDDVRYAARSLGRARALTVLVVFTLALGIAMTSAGFSMLDALVFRPYPVPKPAGVLSVVSTSHDDAYDLFSYREYKDLAGRSKSFGGLVANTQLTAMGFGKGGKDTPRVQTGMMVSANFFRVLGVEPQLGRGFRDDEDAVPGRDPVVVLDREFFKREFASDPATIGRTVRVNGAAFTVIGVAPEGFRGMQIFVRPDLYVPLAMANALSTDHAKDFFEARDDRELVVKARLAPGVTLAQARDEVARIAKSLEREHPVENRNRGAAVHTMIEMRTRADDLNWKFSAIFALLGFSVLLVACTNVAGMLLGRAATRTREIAVRMAMGAGRSRLVRMLLTESLLLALMGGVAGIALGYVAIRLLGLFQIPGELPVTVPFRMDTRVLAMCVTAAMSSAVLCGLAPALQLTRTSVIDGLKASRSGSGGGQRLWARNALVVAQVAMSLMLLTASFLMARGFNAIVRDGLGFPKDNLLMVTLDPRLVQYDAQQSQQFYEQLTARVRELPGVRSAGLTLNPPLGQGAFETLKFVPAGYAMPRDREFLSCSLDAVDEGYFATMGVPLKAGRGFARSDTREAPRVAVVNEYFAKHYWPNGDALGQRFWLDRRGGTAVEIVGIAAGIRYHEGSRRPIDFVYVPLAQQPYPRLVMLARTSGDALATLPAVRNVVRSLNANLPLVDARTYEDLYRYADVDGPGFAIKLVGSMGVVALLLALAGLYGLIAFTVSRRTHEIGIRMALGAEPRDVLRLVMGKGLLLVGIGTAIGLVLGVGIEQMMNAMVFDAGHVDLLTYAIVVPLMLLVSAGAAYLPARQATRIAPTEALRQD